MSLLTLFPRLLLLGAVLSCFCSPAGAQTQTASLGPTNLYLQVPMLQPAPGPHPDLDALLDQYWHKYWKADGPLGIGPDDIKVGRADLNDDDEAELFLMIDRPSWLGIDGKQFVIATWRDRKWVAIGWGWADEDSIWVTTEKVGGWRSVNAGNYIMRWEGSAYGRSPKTPKPDH